MHYNGTREVAMPSQQQRKAKRKDTSTSVFIKIHLGATMYVGWSLLKHRLCRN